MYACDVTGISHECDQLFYELNFQIRYIYIHYLYVICSYTLRIIEIQKKMFKNSKTHSEHEKWFKSQ